MAGKKAAALKLGISVTDVFSVLSHLNEFVALISSIYALAQALYKKVTGKAAPKSFSAPKPTAAMSFSSIMDILRMIEALLKQILDSK